MPFPTQQLDSVLTYIRGITFKPDDVVKTSDNDAVVCMRTKNVQTALDESDLIAVPAKFVKRDEQYLQEKDILISSANSWNLVGKSVQIPKLNYVATAGGFISILRPNETIIDGDYLFLWIMSPSVQHDIRHLGRQTTNISNLDRKRFLKLEIPLPPLDVQKHIVKVLKEADKLRKHAVQLEIELNQLAKSIFQSSFGDFQNLSNDSFTPLDECAKVISGITKGQKFGKNKTINVPYLRVANVQDGYLNLSEIKTIEVREDSYKRYLLQDGDVLLTEGGDFDKLGRGAVYHGKIDN